MSPRYRLVFSVVAALSWPIAAAFASGLGPRFLGLAGGSAAVTPRDFEIELAELASPDPSAAAAALSLLLAGGDAAVRAACAGFEAESASVRRVRARFLALAVGPETLSDVLLRLDDPDPAVRSALIAGLGSPRLAVGSGQERVVEALAARLAREGELAVKLELGAALGRSASDRALDALEAWLGIASRRTPSGVGADAVGVADASQEGRAAARALAARPTGRARLVAWLDGALASGELGLSAGHAPEVALEEWLVSGLGEGLAETSRVASLERDVRIFDRLARHPSARVRARVEDAVDAYFERLRFLGEHLRADAAAVQLLGHGLNDVELRLSAARGVLEDGREPEAALAPADALVLELGSGLDVTRRRALAAAYLLRGAGELCARRIEAADRSFASGAAVLDALLEERVELHDEDLDNFAIDALDLRGVAEAWRLLADVVAGKGPLHASVLEHALEVHRCSLRAHALRRARAGGGNAYSLDAILLHRSGPLQLFAINTRAGGVPRDARLAALRRFGDALATVAPDEMPGFHAAAAPAVIADFTEDPSRLELFRDAREAERDAAARAGRNVSGDDASFGARVRQERWPSDLALTLSAALREDGRPEEARAVAEQLRSALETHELRQSYGIENLIALAERSIGDSYTDQNDGERADQMLNRALDRLAALEETARTTAELGAFEKGLRRQRAGILRSLAVNANVKRKQPALALEYFERSLALEEDESSRVLLACYRARAGRVAEARALLAEIPDAPVHYYNLACTWALLGERETAIAYLARELADPDASKGSRERQKAWAKDDPDLVSLYADPRFQELVQ